MAPIGLLRISLSGSPIWDLRKSDYSTQARIWQGARSDPSIGGRPRVCWRGTPPRMPCGCLPRDHRCTCSKGSRERKYYILGFHGLARQRRQEKGQVCRKPVEAIKEVAKRDGKDGEHIRICSHNTAQRSLSVSRHRARVPTFSSSSKHARLVYFPVRRPVLPMRGTPVRMGPIPVVVYPADGYLRYRTATQWVPCSQLHRRLPDLPCIVRYSGAARTLCRGEKEYQLSPAQSRVAAAAYERRMDRFKNHRASRSCGGLRENAILRHTAQGIEGPVPSPSLTATSQDGETMGRSEDGSTGTQRRRCRLSHRSIRDLVVWKKLSNHHLSGRPITPCAVEASMHTDAADVGYGGTLNTEDMRAGIPGQLYSQGIWSWQDRAQSINLRELRAIRKLLASQLGASLLLEGKRELLLHVDNQAVVYVTDSFVSAIRPMMRELRRLKYLLDDMGIRIRSEWIPSVANKFADALSRRFPKGDLQTRKQLRHSVLAGTQARIDAFRYRPLGEHPAFLRRQTLQELASTWNPEEVRLLCPPVDLIGATLHKMVLSQAPAVLLIPDWKRQPWHQASLRMASRVTKLDLPPTEIWEGQRTLNPAWRMLMLEINLE